MTAKKVICSIGIVFLASVVCFSEGTAPATEPKPAAAKRLLKGFVSPDAISWIPGQSKLYALINKNVETVDAASGERSIVYSTSFKDWEDSQPLTVSPDGNMFTLKGDHKAFVYDAAGKKLKELFAEESKTENSGGFVMTMWTTSLGLTWSADGKSILYYRVLNNPMQIFTINPLTLAKKEIYKGNYVDNIQWIPNKNAVSFIKNKSMYSMNIDNSKQEKLFDIPDNIYSWFPDGTKVLYEHDYALYIYDLTAKTTVKISDCNARSDNDNYKSHSQYSISPDGKKVAFSFNQYTQSMQDLKNKYLGKEYSDIMLYDLETKIVTNITSTPEVWETDPQWSPDGTEILCRQIEGRSKIPLIIDLKPQ